MDVVVVESPAKAKTINKYLGQGLQGSGLVRPCPRSAGQGRLGAAGRGFRHVLGGRHGLGQAPRRHRQGGQGCRRPDPRHRPGSRGRSDLLARAGSAEAEARAEGQAGQPRRLQRHHQVVGARGDGQSAPDRRAAGRCLSRPPRARLSRRLHAVAGAVAQAAGRALGRPRPVGGAAPRLRPRIRDRALQSARNTGTIAAHPRHAAQRDLRGAARSPSTARSCGKLDIADEAQAERHQGDARRRDLHGARRVEAKPTKRNPAPPFTTSTLQQDASSRLGFSASRTMQMAQRLYEGIESAARPPA